MHVTRSLIVAVIGFAGSACAPAISTLKPAHVTPHQSVSGAAGYGLSVPVAGVVRSVGAAKEARDQAKDGEEMTDKQQETVIRTALGMALNPPSLGSEYQLAYGIAD